MGSRCESDVIDGEAGPFVLVVLPSWHVLAQYKKCAVRLADVGNGKQCEAEHGVSPALAISSPATKAIPYTTSGYTQSAR